MNVTFAISGKPFFVSQIQIQMYIISLRQRKIGTKFFSRKKGAQNSWKP